MIAARLSALAMVAASLLVSPRAHAVTASGGAAAAGTTMTPSPAAPPVPARVPLPAIKGWAGESWLNLPRLPDVRYAVVPLSALGVQVPPGGSDPARNVRAVALDDHGGVLLTFEPPLGYYPMIMTNYWSRLSGNVSYRDLTNAGDMPYGAGDRGDDWDFGGELPYSFRNPWWDSPLPSLAQLSPDGRHATSLWAGSSATTGAWPNLTWHSPGAQAAILTPQGAVRLPASGLRIPGTVDHRTHTQSAPLTVSWSVAMENDPVWTNGPRHNGSFTHSTSVWSEAVGVNRLGDAIVRETELDYLSTRSQTIVVLGTGPSNNPDYSFTESYGGYNLHRVAGRIYHTSSPAGTDLIGRVERRTNWDYYDNWPGNIHTASWVPSVGGETLDPRYLNDLRMVAGYRVTSYAPDSAGNVVLGNVIVPVAGVFDQFQNWFPLPPLAGRGPIGPQGPTPSQRLVLAGLTSGYAVGGAQLAPPVVYGWENLGTTASPDLRAWWAYAVTSAGSVSWIKDRLAVADPAPRQPLRPGPFPLYGYWDDPLPVWKVNDRLEMVLGDSRVIRNSEVQQLNGGLVSEGWLVSSARDINSRGMILADCYQAGISAPAQPALLLPVEWLAPAGDPVNDPVEGGDGVTVPGGGSPLLGANEFTYSASGSGSFIVVLQARVTGLDALPAAVQAQFVFEVDAIGGSTRVWASGTPNGQPIITGDLISAAVAFHGLPQSHSAFGTKRATLRFNGAVVSRQTFEVFFPRDEKNHPGTDSGVSPNWFFYWEQVSREQLSSDPINPVTVKWQDGANVQADFANVPFMRYWFATPSGSPYAGPIRQVYVASTLAKGDVPDSTTGLPIDWTWQSRASASSGTTSGIDAFHVTMLHERWHIKQILDSEQLPYWKKNGPARDGAAKSGWAWNISPGGSDDNHFDPGSDGSPGGTGADADTDLDSDLDGLGKDPRPGGKDLDNGYSSVELQARSVETEPDNTKARLDWGNPGKNHKTVNNAND
jgi:hypothetical protein